MSVLTIVGIAIVAMLVLAVIVSAVYQKGKEIQSAWETETKLISTQFQRSHPAIYYKPEIYFGKVESSIAILQDPDYPHRRDIVNYMGQYFDKRFVKPLFQALNDEDPHVRSSATYALANYAEHYSDPVLKRRIVKALTLAVQDRNEWVRKAAAEQLRKIKETE
jgi:hypothetical protein